MRRKISLLIVLCWIMQMLLCINSFAAPTTDQTKQAAQTMQSFGIIHGYPDGQLHLEDKLTRAEMVTLLVNATGYSADAKLLQGAPAFPDTGYGWYSGDIAIAKSKGWVSGFPDGKFHPDDKVTYGQLIQMLDNVLGLKVNAALGWPERAIKAAVDAGFIPTDENISAYADSYAPRGAAFFFANAAFETVPLASGKTLYQEQGHQNIPNKPTTPATPTTPTNPTTPTTPETPSPSAPGGSSDSSDSSNYTPPPSPMVSSVMYEAVYGDSARINITSTNTDVLYYVLLPAGQGTPSSSQIKLGQNGAGQAVAAGMQGNQQVTGSTSSIVLTNLNGNTTYILYVVGFSNAGGLSTVKQLSFTTLPPSPSVSSVVYEAVYGDSARVQVTFANTDTLFYVLLPADQLAPSPMQIKLGQNGAGQAVAAGMQGNQQVTGSTGSIVLPNLNVNTAYILYVVGYSNAGVLSTVKQLAFKTANVTPTVTGAVYSAANGSGHTVNIVASFANASKLYYVVTNDDVPANADQVKSATGFVRLIDSRSFDVANLTQKSFQVTVPNSFFYSIYIVVEIGGRLSDVYPMDFQVP